MTEREICWVFYITKGHLVDIDVMTECYDSYFKRAWGNHENEVSAAGFENCYEEWIQQSLQTVAVLGYD
jgi:hypothetical protein